MYLWNEFPNSGCPATFVRAYISANALGARKQLASLNPHL